MLRRATQSPPIVHDVYVMGTTYSGSTLLGNALGGHPDAFHAGEVSRLPRFGMGPAATECMLCRVAGRDCPVWRPEVRAEVEAGDASEAVPALRGNTGGTRVVIDSSKYVDWLRAATSGRLGLGRSIRVLLSVRSPFGFAASVRRTDGRPAWEAANMWRDTVYDALRLLGQLALPYVVVRYEDLALDPEPLLRRLCDFLTLDWSADVLEFWNHDAHPLGGNPHAYVWYPGYAERVDYSKEFAADRATGESFGARRFGGWHDDRWREQLTRAEIDQILDAPMLTNLAGMLGYNVGQLLRGG